jgi:hypothetical protein
VVAGSPHDRFLIHPEEASMPVRQRFRAQGDDGKEYEILVYVERKDVGGGSYIDLLPQLWTSGGLRVNVVEQGRRYQIVRTGVILESTDPNRF